MMSPAFRRLRDRLAAYHTGTISFAELDASVRGWIAHVGHADSWGLRKHVLDSLVIRPAEHRRAKAQAGVQRRREYCPAHPSGGSGLPAERAP